MIISEQAGQIPRSETATIRKRYEKPRPAQNEFPDICFLQNGFIDTQWTEMKLKKKINILWQEERETHGQYPRSINQTTVNSNGLIVTGDLEGWILFRHFHCW
jgi:hypothetical protein